MIPPFSVVVPIRNEAAHLRQTAPALKAAVKGLPAEIIYVLNATDDDSAARITAVFDETVRLLDLPEPGKAAALRAGDAAASWPLRVYLDGDVTVAPDTLKALLDPLVEGRADFTAPRIRVNLSTLTGPALRIARVWGDQMARRQDAFMACTAINAAGLRARGSWPDVLADDDWARSRIPIARRLIVEETSVEVSLPRDLRNWLRVRARWIRGTRQLRAMKIPTPPPHNIRPRGSLPDLAVYYLVRILAEPLAYIQQWKGETWGRDDSTRG